MFGDLLKKLRKNRGYSQRDLAASVGVDYTYLSKIENGVLPPPSDETIIRIAQALGIQTDELLLAANRVPPDVTDLVTRSKSIPELLRITKDMSEDELRRLVDYADTFRQRST